jgi:TonB family protein
MHPATAQSLLAPRPSKVVPFFALSIAAHVALIALGVLASWLISPKMIDLDQKPIHASLVRLGKPRDEKLLPRKEEPPPPVKEEKAPEPVPVPVAEPPKAVAIVGPEPKKPTAKQDGKKEAEARKQLFSAFNKTGKQAKPEDLEGRDDGDPNGDSAREEGERYFGLISAAVRRYYDVSNTIPEAERRTLKAEVAMRVSATGVATDVRIKKGSGNELFDDAVLSAVKKAAPFSPPPEHLRKVLQGGVTLAFSP